MVIEYLERRIGKRSYSVPGQRGCKGGGRNTSKPHCPICSSPARTFFPFYWPLSSVSLCPKKCSQLYPPLLKKKKMQEGQGEIDQLVFLTKDPLENDNNLLTNCSDPPSWGRKFQVTVRASPTGAKLEKVHFNRTSVPLTASSTPEV